jgi:hypothetical protein
MPGHALPSTIGKCCLNWNSDLPGGGAIDLSGFFRSLTFPIPGTAVAWRLPHDVRSTAAALVCAQGATRMSVLGIASSSLFQYLHSLSSSSSSTSQAGSQNFQQEFQQLGQDLSSGNLSGAQADFQALQPSTQPGSSSPQGSLTTAMNQLATDLKSGNLSGAQQDYSKVQQDVQQMSSGLAGHHHHHHSHATAQDSSQNPISQLFNQLGQDLQSNNISAAQSAYSSLQQEFQQMGAPAATSAPVSVSA